MKKCFSFVLILCIILSGLCSCGKKPAANEAVLALYHLYILNDAALASEIGLSQTDIDAARSAYDDALAQTIRTNFSQSGLEIDDETIAAICEARKSALSKLSAVCVILKEEDSQATVLLQTTYFDEVTLDVDAAYDARDLADAQGFSDYDEYLAFLMEKYTENLIAAYYAVTPSSDTIEITVPCTIMGNMWLPDDMAAFGSDLGAAVTGIEN